MANNLKLDFLYIADLTKTLRNTMLAHQYKNWYEAAACRHVVRRAAVPPFLLAFCRPSQFLWRRTVYPEIWFDGEFGITWGLNINQPLYLPNPVVFFIQIFIKK